MDTYIYIYIYAYIYIYIHIHTHMYIVCCFVVLLFCYVFIFVRVSRVRLRSVVSACCSVVFDHRKGRSCQKNRPKVGCCRTTRKWINYEETQKMLKTNISNKKNMTNMISDKTCSTMQIQRKGCKIQKDKHKNRHTYIYIYIYTHTHKQQVGGCRTRTLRTLQCLRLLTRDPGLRKP